MKNNKWFNNKNSKKSNLQRSLSAHERLVSHHLNQYKKTNNDVNWLKHGYHNDCVKFIKNNNRKPTLEEKKSIYQNNAFYTWN